MRSYFFVFDVFHTLYIGIYATVQAALRRYLLSVDFPRSGIWGKLGTRVQGICLKSCAKFPPNRTMCSRDAIRPQPFHKMMVIVTVSVCGTHVPEFAFYYLTFDQVHSI